MSAAKDPVLMAREELIEEIERLRYEAETLHRLLFAVLDRSELLAAAIERQTEERRP